VPDSLSAVRRYHDETKHHFHRFSRSIGYLDWASQPRPFRRFTGAPSIPLPPRPEAQGRPRALGDLLRHALGLSAWKAFRGSRWALRVNPSSGNLHPTEAYVICGPHEGLSDQPAVYHYAADQHELELRCEFDSAAWRTLCGAQDDVVLIVLTSIHWREAWKYGERAFRYCQHDLGHAIAAIAIAARIAGWNTNLAPAWPHGRVAALAGLDRDEDFFEAEREEPGCLLVLARDSVPSPPLDAGEQLSTAVRNGRWQGRASQLSEDHVQWTFIDEVAAATRDEGRTDARSSTDARGRCELLSLPGSPDAQGWRSLILRRRSAVAFDGVSPTDRSTFVGILDAALPGPMAPWAALWWRPHIHLAVFVHRVEGLEPGLYLRVRDETAVEPLRAALRSDFLWEPVAGARSLFQLARGDCRSLARRLSCDQDIASEGFFSLGMIARFEDSLAEFGPSFYRHLFWESGVVGQVLYLAAEAAGARATGIGCFYDDPVHDLLGLTGHAFQSLYHFTIGMPVEDTRLTTEPGYEWG
jgi:SagB-type dehydrogenase family enzyme